MKTSSDKNGRCLVLTIKIQNQTFKLYNLYAPNEDEPQFFEDIFSEIELSDEDPVIVGGDLNVILNVEKDRRGGRKIKSKCSEVINSFLDQNEWYDGWRTLNKDKFCFTWKGGKPQILSRLDYFLIPGGTFMNVSSMDILPASISDHSPITMTISTEFTMRGPGYWKLNNRNLTDPEFVTNINETLDCVSSRYKMYNPVNKWVKIKHAVKDIAIKSSRRISNAKKEKLKM